MKDNCKNRKLTYIRTKNGLRSGRRRYGWVTKVSTQSFDDVQLNWYEFITHAEEALFKDYKLKLRHGKINNVGLNGDDFINNLISIQVILHN